MAYRRDKTLRQVAEVAPSVLEPGEAIQAAVLVQRGPSPYLIAIPIGLTAAVIVNLRLDSSARILAYAVMGGVFGAIYWLVQRPAIVAVTDRRVLFWRASFWTASPARLERADPRGSVRLDEVREGSLWSRVTYRGPDGRTERFNVGWNWEEPMHAFVSALGVPPGGGPPPPPPPPLASPPAGAP